MRFLPTWLSYLFKGKQTKSIILNANRKNILFTDHKGMNCDAMDSVRITKRKKTRPEEKSMVFFLLSTWPDHKWREDINHQNMSVSRKYLFLRLLTFIHLYDWFPLKSTIPQHWILHSWMDSNGNEQNRASFFFCLKMMMNYVHITTIDLTAAFIDELMLMSNILPLGWPFSACCQS